jgi:hypothetical protein
MEVVSISMWLVPLLVVSPFQFWTGRAMTEQIGSYTTAHRQCKSLDPVFSAVEESTAPALCCLREEGRRTAGNRAVALNFGHELPQHEPQAEKMSHLQEAPGLDRRRRQKPRTGV